MRTDLDHLPEKRQHDLHRIAHAIRTGFEDYCAKGTQPFRKAGRIEKIILFGSFTDDRWVDDVAGGYLSDYDILVVINEPKLVEAEYWWDLDDKFLHRANERKPIVNIIIHTLADLNQKLKDSLYFFVDIYEQGVLLFDRSRSAPLIQPGPLTAEDAVRVARMHDEEWQPRAVDARKSIDFFRSLGNLRWAAFMTHQVVEASHARILLVSTNYLPATHNIRHLNSLTASLDSRLVALWPQNTKFRRRTFQRIKDAYVKARYSPHYQITEEELDWAAERTDWLLGVTEEICERRILKLKQNGGTT